MTPACPGISASTEALTSVPHQPDLYTRRESGYFNARYPKLGSTWCMRKVEPEEEVPIIPRYITGKYLLLHGTTCLTGLPHHSTAPPTFYSTRLTVVCLRL